jgi:acetyl-CoA acyltransferase
MTNAYLIDLVRTPMGRGKMGGALSEIHPVDLATVVVKALVERNKIDPKNVEDLILGCVTAVGEQGMNIGRLVALLALDESVPGIQINRMCSSGLQSIEFAKQAIMAGDAELMIAGGVEHMGRVPMGIDGLPLPMSPNQDTTLSENYLKKYRVKSMGQSGELIAEKWGFTRDALDEFAIKSHQKAYAAQEAGYFKNEIIGVETPSFGLVEKDEGIRESIDREKMKTLPTPFKDGGVVTAANASQITDGASVVLLASEKAIKEYNLKPRAKIIKTHVCAVDPVMQLTGPIPAIKGVLRKTGLNLDDIDLFEINEAFASVVMATQKDLGISDEKVNVNGGAIALGHPLGCSGARLLTTMVNELERRGLKRGLVTMCVGFGPGLASIVEIV